MTALNASFFISVGSKKEDTLFGTPNFWAAFLHIFLICGSDWENGI